MLDFVLTSSVDMTMSLTDASSNPMTPTKMSVTTGVQAVTFLGCVSGSSATKSLIISTASLERQQEVEGQSPRTAQMIPTGPAAPERRSLSLDVHLWDSDTSVTRH